MNQFWKHCSCVMVFTSGFVCALNLSVIKYGVPAHYDASWWKVAISVGLALMFGYQATKKS